jgi:hypothetical protein
MRGARGAAGQVEEECVERHVGGWNRAEVEHGGDILRGDGGGSRRIAKVCVLE